jgi:hypothetical protein
VDQALLDRGLGSCGVAVASAPIKGIWTLPYTTMWMVTPQFLDLRASRRTLTLTRKHFLIAQPGWQQVADYALDRVRERELLQKREARRIVREMHTRQVA